MLIYSSTIFLSTSRNSAIDLFDIPETHRVSTALVHITDNTVSGTPNSCLYNLDRVFQVDLVIVSYSRDAINSVYKLIRVAKVSTSKTINSFTPDLAPENLPIKNGRE